MEITAPVRVKGVVTAYDAHQRCTAHKESHGLSVAMDCPYTGKGAELSPTNLVEAALGGCLLLAMGAYASRHDIDMSGSEIEVKIAASDRPMVRFSAVDITIRMPPGLAKDDRTRLARAADTCPVKHSLDPAIPVSVRYEYPG